MNSPIGIDRFAPGRSFWGLVLFAAALAGGCASPGTPGRAATPAAHAPWGEVADAIGLKLDASLDPDVHAVVLLACATDCPVGNALAPEVNRLQQEFKDRGVVWIAIYPEELMTAERVRKHQEAFGLAMTAFPDATLEVARTAGITTTPEACVYAAGGELVYRGRIDDSWDVIGTRRRAPQSRDLRRVLDALSRGEVLEYTSTPAVGCLLPPPGRVPGA